ncbi:Transcriptional activator CadC [Pelagimonas phthalicica]|uniref:Transcriptional activator CadC n=1 Tax=Pelagimonas phthalicica TaxID=1037362 RepID=A0A238JJ91_9RHOB|nr:winged helix-turn-helix domain-containing protein [Pelagimonas phthalicica]TDS88387.1 transcriptional regulator [Pelagimonas phthalicica]SMX30473.1 Transcriptional activator CadC [Pelagimonas phthalicica]
MTAALTPYSPPPSDPGVMAQAAMPARSRRGVNFFVERFPPLFNLRGKSEAAGPGGMFCVEADEEPTERIALGETFYVPVHDQLIAQDNTPVYLRAQSSKVLRYLTKRLGRVVTREELVNHVWPNLAVTDDSLTQCISDLRRALGDKERKVLKTIPKRGFVLHGEVIAPPVTAVPVFAPSETSQEPVDAFALQMDGPIIAHILDGQMGLTLGAGRQMQFGDIAEAVSAAKPLAHGQGMAVVLSMGQAATPDLLAAAQPGRILADVSVRELAHQHPGLFFEDLGHVGGLSNPRAYRLSEFGVEGGLVPVSLDQPMLPSVAILPLQNIQSDAPDVLGTVFADLISGTLSAAEEINVISRLSTAAFAKGAQNLADIQKYLNAEFVLSGFFIRRGERLQLNLEFADVTSQRLLWSYRVEIAMADLLGDFEAAHEIVAKIRRAIMINEIRRASIRPLESLQTYTLILAAVGLMHRLSPQEFSKARGLLDHLKDRAPRHPVPLAWTARWHLLRVVQGWSDDPYEDAQAALGCTGRALDMDPENVLALACEGHVLTNLLHRLDDAEDRYDLALETNPSDANARALRGMLLAFQDRGDEGVPDTERALRLAPLDPHRFFYLAMAAGAWLTPGNFEKAEEYARASLRLNRTHLSSLRMLAVAQQKSGKYEAARETVADLMRLQPGLRVNSWLKSSPSADFETGRRFAQALRDAGVPD